MSSTRSNQQSQTKSASLNSKASSSSRRAHKSSSSSSKAPAATTSLASVTSGQRRPASTLATLTPPSTATGPTHSVASAAACAINPNSHASGSVATDLSKKLPPPQSSFLQSTWNSHLAHHAPAHEPLPQNSHRHIHADFQSPTSPVVEPVSSASLGFLPDAASNDTDDNSSVSHLSFAGRESSPFDCDGTFGSPPSPFQPRKPKKAKGLFDSSIDLIGESPVLYAKAPILTELDRINSEALEKLSRLFSTHNDQGNSSSSSSTKRPFSVFADSLQDPNRAISDELITMNLTPTMDHSASRGRQDSFVSAGPKAIAIGGANASARNRRESLQNTGSFMGGMSWGGMSLGSFVRDEMAMHGTSPFGAHQSPSFHSSSYLPKLEANFMKDFQCCGRTLNDLHDLLQHYEEAHTNNASPNTRTVPPFSQFSRLNNGSSTGSKGIDVRATQLGGLQQFGGPAQLAQQARQPVMGISGLGMLNQTNMQPTSNLQSMALSEDIGDIGDMDMEDAVGHMEMDDPQQQQQQQSVIQQTRQMFGQGTSRPQIQISSGLTHGLRTSQPTTPAVQSFGLQHNPTVSSVNTPTLSTQPGSGMFPKRTPGAAAFMQPAGMAGEDMNMMDQDFSGMSQNNIGGAVGGMDINSMGGMQQEDGNCIPNPGKNLNSGGLLAHQKILLAQLAMEQPDFQSKAPFLQRLGLLPEENKPFKCPVIGCEKTYKNQNGLKYHKMHGHQSQVLHENEDGTFSIVDPETSAPYPGTQGMEKEKPYHCNVCMKRYKNLNGLKYHRNHSPYCNPDLTQAELLAMTGININSLNQQMQDISQLQEMQNLSDMQPMQE